jgi:hypothetical protein
MYIAISLGLGLAKLQGDILLEKSQIIGNSSTTESSNSRNRFATFGRTIQVGSYSMFDTRGARRPALESQGLGVHHEYPTGYAPVTISDQEHSPGVSHGYGDPEIMARKEAFMPSGSNSQKSESFPPKAIRASTARSGLFGKYFRGSWWTWEILAIITSVICFGAIIVILVSMQNRPLRAWEGAISINTTVATLVAAAKTTMLFAVGSCLGQMKWIYFKSGHRELYHIKLFDSAAGGPLGALEMMLKVRWPIAVIGSLIVLLSLAVDPFAQELVKIEERVDIIPNVSPASFGIIHNYSTTSTESAFGRFTSSE